VIEAINTKTVTAVLKSIFFIVVPFVVSKQFIQIQINAVGASGFEPLTSCV
jgi:hypothetical protein